MANTPLDDIKQLKDMTPLLCSQSCHVAAVQVQVQAMQQEAWTRSRMPLAAYPYAAAELATPGVSRGHVQPAADAARLWHHDPQQARLKPSRTTALPWAVLLCVAECMCP